jgi:phosphopantetheine adenylyltransferase
MKEIQDIARVLAMLLGQINLAERHHRYRCVREVQDTYKAVVKRGHMYTAVVRRDAYSIAERHHRYRCVRGVQDIYIKQ